MGGIDVSAIDLLLEQVNAGSRVALAPLAGGANNRVFHLDTSSGPFLLKSYFRHHDDPRDRLATEFGFARFAWDNGVRSLPQPLACDPVAGLGLFEFIAGKSLQGSVVDVDAIDQALDFFVAINRARREANAKILPNASEACFSIAEHISTVERRIVRLESIPIVTRIDHDARDLIDSELKPLWEGVRSLGRLQAHDLGLSLNEAIHEGDRCLSPSDFGFHNAIVAPDGQLRFIDFEYAGWDDPSKLICDFFCQPAVPAPLSSFEHFAGRVANEFDDPDKHQARASLLLPVYRMKWVCIMLNDFLPVGQSRRAFSKSAAEQEERKASQLKKARSALEVISRSANPTRKVA